MTADRELEKLLSDCRFTTSPEQEQRIMDEIAGVMKDRPTKLLFGRRSTRTFELRLAVVVCLAVVILVGFLLRERPQAVVWAEVQKKVAEQEWIHRSGAYENGETIESWSSATLQIDAWRIGGNFHFVNYKTGIQESYNAKRKTITRSSLGKRERSQLKELQGWSEMFSAIASGEGSVNSPAPEVQMVSQSSRQVERDGKRWIEFEIKILGPGQDIPHALVFLVNPKARLIRSMEVSHPDENFKTEFSYPKTGPQSIYDLGVPKSAKLIDLRPSDEIQSLIDGVRSSAEKFGPYIALNVMQDPDAPWYVGTPQKVWADGKKMRMEYGIVDPATKAFQKPGPDADATQWWSERWEQLWHVVVEVSDGKQGYSNVAQPKDWGTTEKPHPVTWDTKNWPEPKWRSFELDDWPIAVAGSPLFYAYSPDTRQRGRGNTKAILDATPENGPPGTVLLTCTVESENPESASTERFWIDPKRSHIVMKYELIHGPLPGTDRYTVTIKELEKSTRGIWYPTLVSHKTSTEKDGKTTEMETLTRHYFDFDAAFPKGVFEPKALSESK